MEDQFGGENSERTKLQYSSLFKSQSAYMLVYIREAEWDEIMRQVSEEDVALHLRERVRVRALRVSPASNASMDPGRGLRCVRVSVSTLALPPSASWVKDVARLIPPQGASDDLDNSFLFKRVSVRLNPKPTRRFRGPLKVRRRGSAWDLHRRRSARALHLANVALCAIQAPQTQDML